MEPLTSGRQPGSERAAEGARSRGCGRPGLGDAAPLYSGLRGRRGARAEAGARGDRPPAHDRHPGQRESRGTGPPPTWRVPSQRSRGGARPLPVGHSCRHAQHLSAVCCRPSARRLPAPLPPPSPPSRCAELRAGGRAGSRKGRRARGGEAAAASGPQPANGWARPGADPPPAPRPPPQHRPTPLRRLPGQPRLGPAPSCSASAPPPPAFAPAPARSEDRTRGGGGQRLFCEPEFPPEPGACGGYTAAGLCRSSRVTVLYVASGRSRQFFPSFLFPWARLTDSMALPEDFGPKVLGFHRAWMRGSGETFRRWSQLTRLSGGTLVCIGHNWIPVHKAWHFLGSSPGFHSAYRS